MTDEQYDLIQRLSRCRFYPASFDKRFARDMTSLPKDHELTERQARYLEVMRYRYRRQLHEPDAPKVEPLPPEPAKGSPCSGRVVRMGPRERNERIALERWNAGEPRVD